MLGCTRLERQEAFLQKNAISNEVQEWLRKRLFNERQFQKKPYILVKHGKYKSAKYRDINIKQQRSANCGYTL
jgi:hypothetical protein